MSGSSTDAFVRDAWRPLGHRIAVASGSLVGLVSLLNDVRVSTASLRGAAAYFAILLTSWLGSLAMDRALDYDERKRRHEATEEAES